MNARLHVQSSPSSTATTSNTRHFNKSQRSSTFCHHFSWTRALWNVRIYTKVAFYFYSTRDSLSVNIPSFVSSRRYPFFNSSMSRIHSVYCVSFSSRHMSDTMYFRKCSIAIDWMELIAQKARPLSRDHADVSRCNSRIFFFSRSSSSPFDISVTVYFPVSVSSTRLHHLRRAFPVARLTIEHGKLRLSQSWTQPRFF